MAGVAIVGFLCIVAVFAPLLAPHDPQTIDTWHILEAPSANHLFGTDSLGRDCLSRLIYGARISLLVGIVAVGLATIIGTLLGAIAGFHGK